MKIKEILRIIMACSVLISVITFASCNKDDDIVELNPDDSCDFYTNLVAVKDSLKVGDSTKVRAITNGNGLTYQWSTNNNAPLIEIAGTDAEVYFYADPCIGFGESKVYCKVTKESTSLERHVIIMIVE